MTRRSDGRIDASGTAGGADGRDVGRTSPVDGPSEMEGQRRGASSPQSRVRLRAAVALGGLLGVGAGVAVSRLPPLFVIGVAAALSVVALVLLRPFAGLLIYTFLFVVRPGEQHPVLSAVHLERVVGWLALVGTFVGQYHRHRRVTVDWSRQTQALLLLLGAVLLSVPLAFWRSGAVSGLIDFSKLLVFYFLVVELVSSRRRLRVFVGTLIGLIVYVAGSSFRAYLQGSVMFAQGIDRAVGETSAGGDPNALATTLMATFPIALLLASYRAARWSKVVLLGAVILFVMTLVVTGSRSGVLAFLGCLMYLWLSSRHRLRNGMLVMAVVAVGVLLLPEQYRTRYSTIGSSELDASSEGRIEAWKRGARMVMDRPLCGVGIGCFSAASGLSYSAASQRSWLQPHSVYVQVPAELGLLGAGAFFLFVMEMLRSNRRMRRRLEAAGGDWDFERLLLRGLFGGVIVLMITGVFGHSFMRWTWYIYGALGVSVARIVSNEVGS